jgi:hypothetical protein
MNEKVSKGVNLMAFFLEHGVLTEDVKWVGGALL